ncbi:MAG: winged helix-turn-helix domain-containing protein [Acidimicrobiales bacterium]|jgi:DNA-binding transcriptional ArsR family regulator
MVDNESPMITDVKVIAAMTHPLRRRLLSLLRLDGPSTVGVLAQQTGQAPGNISHHLKALAAAGLVEEVPELARDRRERWWRRSTPTIRWTTEDFKGDAETEAIARAAVSLNLDYQLNQLRQWDNLSDEEKNDWKSGPFSTDHWMRLNNDELSAFRDELIALVSRWEDREVPDDGSVRPPVFFFAHAVPGQP